jgi:flagellar FliJ protein
LQRNLYCEQSVNISYVHFSVMKRSQRLQPVVKVAEGREQQAVRALGRSQQVLTEAEQRLAELITYREEYIRRFHSVGATGMSAVQMGDYRQFLHKLSLAIGQQEGVVAQAKKAVEEQRRHWFKTRGKVQMLDNVVSRYAADEQRAADRKEQHEQDEHAQRPRRDKGF